MIICKNCGYKNKDGSRLCEGCGYCLEEGKTGKKRRGLAVWIAAGAVAAAAVVAAAVFLLLRNMHPETAEADGGRETEDYTEVDINGVDNAYITVSGTIAGESGELVLIPARPVSVCALDSGNQIVKAEGVTEIALSGNKNAGSYVGAEVSIRGNLAADGDGKFELKIVDMDIQKAAPVPPEELAEDHRYLIVQADVTWQEAYESCISRGGYLLRIGSEEEFQKVISMIEEADMQNVHFYLGGFRKEEGREYCWVDQEGQLMEPALNPEGTSWAASHWMKDEPSFVSGDDLELYMNLVYYQEEWVLNDVPMDITVYYPGRTGYIVEFDE